MTGQTCEKCDGMGMLVNKQPDGRFLADPCECRVSLRNEQLHRRSGIPERYKRCTLGSYKLYNGAHASLAEAKRVARDFVANYHTIPRGTGLLFTGGVGTGKTHLAVAILQALVLEQGVKALFCDHRQLLKSIHHSYNPNVPITELEVLTPVFDAEVLILDELGSAKKTEWVSDIVEHILNRRYNDNRTTIITTNYPNERAGRAALAVAKQSRKGETGSASSAPPTSPTAAPAADFENHPALLGHIFSMDSMLGTGSQDRSKAGRPDEQPAPRPVGWAPAPAVSAVAPATAPASDLEMANKGVAAETLGDRIGERMLSRLAEMCVEVRLAGDDYRRKEKKAQFS